jgi:hypothetical protein
VQSLWDALERDSSSTKTVCGGDAYGAFADLDDDVATDIPAFFAAANKGAGMGVAITLGAVPEVDADEDGEVCIRVGTADFMDVLDGTSLEEDLSAEEPVPSSSLASRKNSASLRFFLEAETEEDDADKADA